MPTTAKNDIRYIAAKLLDLFGSKGQHWIRNDYADGKGNYCLMGGLEKLEMNDKSIILQDAIAAYTDNRYRDVEDFNDSRKWPAIKKFLCSLIKPSKKEKK